MKNFLFAMFIFSIILLGLAFATEYVISHNMRSPREGNMFGGWNEIYSGNLQNDIIIMGSSRAYVQYDPQVFDTLLGVDSYNLGINASNINRQIIKYDFYRRYNAKPKVIIHNIDYLTMSITRGFRREQFFPYFFDDALKTEVLKYENLNFLQKYLPAFKYYGSTIPILNAIGILNIKEKFVKGYFGREGKWDGSGLAQQTEINYSNDNLALSLFDEYLTRAYSENIKVIFVYAPIYIGATEKIKDIDGMYQMYESIAGKYNIPILDYTYDPISYDTAYFYNAMHLNKEGAELFSAKLAHDIDSLGLLIK